MKEPTLSELLEEHYHAAVKSVKNKTWLYKVEEIELKIIEKFSQQEKLIDDATKIIKKYVIAHEALLEIDTNKIKNNLELMGKNIEQLTKNKK